MIILSPRVDIYKHVQYTGGPIGLLATQLEAQVRFVYQMAWKLKPRLFLYIFIQVWTSYNHARLVRTWTGPDKILIPNHVSRWRQSGDDSFSSQKRPTDSTCDSELLSLRLACKLFGLNFYSSTSLQELRLQILTKIDSQCLAKF